MIPIADNEVTPRVTFDAKDMDAYSLTELVVCGRKECLLETWI
jgi:hypothetical protein